MPYHEPVLLAECLTALDIKSDGVYVDVTFGGGGHSRAILEQLSEQGHLLAFDQDPDAAANARDWPTTNFTFIPANFRYLSRFLRLHGYPLVDGILADLGVSSHQLDVPERGFSFREDAPLDMRMNAQQPLSAAGLLETASLEELHRIFGMYGDVRNAKTLAAALLQARAQAPIQTTFDLRRVAEGLAPKHREFKYLAQVFQAIRIAVNEEVQVLEEFLQQVPEVLKPQGRLVVMAYHSTEDRLVKHFIQKGKFGGDLETDLRGQPLRPLIPLTRKPITADPTACAANPRARSAKLRIAQKAD
ncbi:MAG: 16S rRNA (cytosine(1402)-N(4))-methyltransferase RsmH [Bernardetiaceae bacterium]